MNSIERRVGRLQISHDLLFSNPKAVQKVLSKVIVVRCESIFYKKCFEYVALSNRFDIIDEASEPPLYQAVVKNGFVSFVKIS